ncbi:putative PEP-binding protein [Streptomyces sp. NPDC006632]|uniref:putative PEP-binding protein n=1 Tax=unclassified Streptomyces TaxID=2593676 RepID=UPI002E23178F
MRQRLSLSGEIPPAAVVEAFDGVGLIRSEYVIRAGGHFISARRTQDALREYVAAVARAVPDRPIWYRTSEMTSQEANTLIGVDRTYTEADFMKGRRGVRRARETPEAFETELRVVAEVAADHPNLHVLAPFVRDAEDLAFVADTLDRMDWPNRFGSMVEIPSALFDIEEFAALGASNFLLGLNDLSSTLTATTREFWDMKLHPSVWWAIDRVASLAKGASWEWGLAGNLSPAVVERAEFADVPYVSMHYSELPKLLGWDENTLPDIDLVARTKAFTREQIARAEERALRERLGLDAVAPTGKAQTHGD